MQRAYSARLSKQHNNSNIIAFGARVIGVEMAKMIVDEWVNAKYEAAAIRCAWTC